MTALLLYTCLMSGADCRYHLAAEGLGQMECQVLSQQLAARFIGDNPNRRFVSAVCDDARKVGFYLGRNQA